ncbi:MAG: CotH kinase family protein [Chitinispirillaceae bacterium]|nr:CotH kinase family protein [Chitinispirillaceae bacterium]
MRRGSLLICILFVWISRSFGEDADSSDLIFNDSVVHSYTLEFYVSEWDSILEYNKEVADEEYMPARLTYCIAGDENVVVLDSIGVRYKGNSSYEMAKNTPKKSFKFHFDEYIQGQSFFGCERLNFHNCVLDPSLMREKIGYDIARKYMAAPRTAYATITVDTVMIGVYTQVEQVDEHFLERNFDNPDGNLYKAGDDGAVLTYKGPNQSTYEALYELKTNESDDNWENFVNMLYKLNNSTAEKFASDMKTCLDLDNCINHLAWTIVLSHFDSYTGSGRNYYMYDDPKSGRFFIIPWDLNLSFGQYSNGWNMITNSAVVIENLKDRPLNQRILENDSLKAVYLERLTDMIAGPASAESIAAEADRLKGIIDSVVKVEPEISKFYTYEQFATNIDSNLEIPSGLTNTIILGIKSFPVQRNPELMQQIRSGVSHRTAAAGHSGNFLECAWNAAASSVWIGFTGSAGAGTTHFALYDCHGRAVDRMTVPHLRKGRIRWKTGNAVPGVYSIVMKNGGTSLTDRILITQ